MTDKLKESKKKSYTLSSVRTESKQSKVPEGAKILSKDESISVEEIENGWLIIKSCDVKYVAKGKDDNDYNYAYYTEKYYSKENPLEIKLTDESLSDAFDGE